MSTVLSSDIPIRTDQYFEDQSKRAIAKALEEAERMELDAEQTLFLIKRSYPFGIGRSQGHRGGREYKIWRKQVLAAEADLGLEPRTHKDARGAEEAKTGGKKFELPSTRDEFMKQVPEPKNLEQAAAFLRRHCKAAVFYGEDYDRLRVTLKQHDFQDRRIKHEISVYVQTGEKAEWDAAFLSAAKDAYKVFLSNELEKY